jgi:hypothetical protein
MEPMKPVFTAIVLGWKGRDLAKAWPWRVRFYLFLSRMVLNAYALKRHARPFSLLSPVAREGLLVYLSRHPSPYVRRLVRWWKQLALVSAC